MRYFDKVVSLGKNTLELVHEFTVCVCVCFQGGKSEIFVDVIERLSVVIGANVSNLQLSSPQNVQNFLDAAGLNAAGK